MARQVRSAFVMFGRYKGTRAENKNSFKRLLFHDFKDTQNHVVGDTETMLNDIGYDYRNEYKVIVRSDDFTDTSVLYINRLLPNGLEKEEVKVTIRPGEYKKIYLEGTDLVLGFGLTDLWQQMDDKEEAETVARNLKIVEKLSKTEITLTKKLGGLSITQNEELNENPSFVTPTVTQPELGEDQ